MNKRAFLNNACLTLLWLLFCLFSGFLHPGAGGAPPPAPRDSFFLTFGVSGLAGAFSNSNSFQVGVQKLTRSGFRRGTFEKTNLPFLRPIKILYPRRESCLQNAHFYKQKGPCFRNPVNWTGSVFPFLTQVRRFVQKGESGQAPHCTLAQQVMQGAASCCSDHVLAILATLGHARIRWG